MTKIRTIVGSKNDQTQKTGRMDPDVAHKNTIRDVISVMIFFLRYEIDQCLHYTCLDAAASSLSLAKHTFSPGNTLDITPANLPESRDVNIFPAHTHPHTLMCNHKTQTRAKTYTQRAHLNKFCKVCALLHVIDDDDDVVAVADDVIIIIIIIIIKIIKIITIYVPENTN